MVEINKQISLGTDDGTESNQATIDLIANELYVGHYDPNQFDMGLRWQSINIVQAATITSAKLSLYMTVDLLTLAANIRGIDEDNTLTWAADDRPSQRTKTTATITANEANWNNWAADSWIDIDITSVIQEIVNRVGWSANNDLAIVVEDTSGSGYGSTTVRSFEYAGNAHGAKLDIVYDEATKIPVIIHHLQEQGIL